MLLLMFLITMFETEDKKVIDGTKFLTFLYLFDILILYLLL